MSWTVSNLQRPLREDLSLEISGIIAEKGSQIFGRRFVGFDGPKKSGALFQFLKGRWRIGPLWKPPRSSKPADWMAAAASSLTSAEGCSARCKDGCEMSGTGSPSRHTSRERHIRTGLAYRLTEKRRQSGFKNRQRPVILAPHTRWASCCWRRSRSRRPFTFKAVGRNGKRRISSYFCVKSCVSISVIVMCER